MPDLKPISFRKIIFKELNQNRRYKWKTIRKSIFNTKKLKIKFKNNKFTEVVRYDPFDPNENKIVKNRFDDQ